MLKTNRLIVIKDIYQMKKDRIYTDTHLCAIVIPVYKESIDKYEELSFRQCLKVLYRYPIFLLTHEHLDTSVYDNIAKDNNVKLDRSFFADEYFGSIAGYNSLLKSKQFYNAFEAFRYILIYQLDAFVFRDELEDWCKKEYDYIGAPWIADNNGELMERKYWKVGNGGLSLRKVSYCLKVLSWKGPVLKYSYYKKLKYLPYILGWKNNMRYFLKSKLNEDGIFGGLLTPSYINPKLPSPKEAALFAFENPPLYMYHMCNNQLPFGCHAFLKFEYETFWKQYIEVVNHNR